MKKLLTSLLFGPRAKGEKLPQPTLRTTPIHNRPGEQQWAKDYNFGARYGHRGSFYQPSYF